MDKIDGQRVLASSVLVNELTPEQHPQNFPTANSVKPPDTAL